MNFLPSHVRATTTGNHHPGNDAMNNSSRRPLENYGDTCCCPQCRAWVYRNTLRNGKCIKCNLLRKREPTLEELIEALAMKLEGAK